MSARDTAAAMYVADNGGERWELPGDEAFEAGWDAGVKAVLDRVRKVMSRAHVPDDVWPQVDAIARDFEVDDA